jgi:hypothetical protein
MLCAVSQYKIHGVRFELEDVQAMVGQALGVHNGFAVVVASVAASTEAADENIIVLCIEDETLQVINDSKFTSIVLDFN